MRVCATDGETVKRGILCGLDVHRPSVAWQRGNTMIAQQGIRDGKSDGNCTLCGLFRSQVQHLVNNAVLNGLLRTHVEVSLRIALDTF